MNSKNYKKTHLCLASLNKLSHLYPSLAKHPPAEPLEINCCGAHVREVVGKKNVWYLSDLEN